MCSCSSYIALPWRSSLFVEMAWGALYMNLACEFFVCVRVAGMSFRCGFACRFGVGSRIGSVWVHVWVRVSFRCGFACPFGVGSRVVSLWVHVSRRRPFRELKAHSYSSMYRVLTPLLMPPSVLVRWLFLSCRAWSRPAWIAFDGLSFVSRARLLVSRVPLPLSPPSVASLLLLIR